MTAQQERNLAKARRAKSKRAEQNRRERARLHQQAERAYERECNSYYRTRRIHGEGSVQEKRAFRRMVNAEAEWFRTYPRS